MKKLTLLILAMMVMAGFTGTAGAFSYENYIGEQQFFTTNTPFFAFDLASDNFLIETTNTSFSLDTDVNLDYPPPIFESGYVNVVLGTNPSGGGGSSGNMAISLLIYSSTEGLGNTYLLYEGLVTGSYQAIIPADVLAAFNSVNEGWGRIILTANSDFYLTEAGIGVQPVPVPPAVLLLGTGLVGLFALKRRKTVS
jgi:hypothetical protein